MKYGDILSVYPALMEFSSIKLPTKKAWKLWRIIADVRERYEFYCAEELKIASLYAVCSEGKPIVTNNGSISFSSDDNRRDYVEEILKLKAADAGGIEQLEIQIQEIENTKLSAETIEQLYPLVKIIDNTEVPHG